MTTRRAAAAVVFAAALAFNLVAGRLANPVGYPYNMVVADLRIASTIPYYTRQDLEAVRHFLRSLGVSGKPVTVRFFPEADALLFYDLHGAGVRFIQPTLRKEKADVYIVHDSRYLPKGMPHMMMLQINLGDGISMKGDNWRLLHRRDGTERWLVHPPGAGGR